MFKTFQDPLNLFFLKKKKKAGEAWLYVGLFCWKLFQDSEVWGGGRKADEKPLPGLLFCVWVTGDSRSPGELGGALYLPVTETLTSR